MTSNSLDKWQRGDERITCQIRSMHMREEPDMIWYKSRQVSDCPIEKGVVRTRWGTVSPGHVIAGIAAAFQGSNVSLARIMEDVDNDYNITETFDPVGSNAMLDNIIVTTIVGDLAEVTLNQAFNNPVFGDIGRWNDTTFPRAHYLDREQWDMTNAELLGGIDGKYIFPSVNSKITNNNCTLV